MASDASTDALVESVPPRPFPTYDALAYGDFLRNHLIPNTPFLLSPAATAHWPARRDWALPSGPASSASVPNFSGLEPYADHIVPVADTAEREFSEFARTEQPLRDVLDGWRAGNGGTLYVKDWHLVAELGDPRGVYAPPDCFLDDWLSPPFDATQTHASPSMSASTADFRFVYAGPRGTFTPLHRDVYGSYSWSANVVGRKLWWLFPPGTEPRDKHGELVFDVRGGASSSAGILILQAEGEVIFVPSGWHHQVLNLDFCISINHNFFSSPTLPRVYAALRANEARCAESIADILPDIKARLGDAVLPNGTRAWEAEWAAEVDGLLARDAGWGWTGFWSCARDNLKRPPAPESLSPPRAQRDAIVRDVIAQYKATREWILLPEPKPIIAEIEALLDAP